MDKQYKEPQDYWIPACGGTEKEFTYNGKRWLYMWNITGGEHAYYCYDDDLFYEYLPEGK